MNTLLPLPNFALSAESLEDGHLAKQRSDVVQILKACAEPPPEDGREHASIKMWRGNEPALIKYGMAVCFEYASRGQVDATLKKILAFKSIFEEASELMPEWFGDEAFHDSHKAHLLRLRPTHYRQYWPDLSDDLPLIWPRSPKKNAPSPEQREADRLYKKAVKAKNTLERAQVNYQEICEAAGIDPETFEYLDGAEVVEIGVPDPDVIDL